LIRPMISRSKASFKKASHSSSYPFSLLAKGTDGEALSGEGQQRGSSPDSAPGLRRPQSLLRVIKLYDHKAIWQKIYDHKRSLIAPSSSKEARLPIKRLSRKLFSIEVWMRFAKISRACYDALSLLCCTYCLGEDVSCYFGEGVACLLRYRIDFLHDFITKLHFNRPRELAGIEAG